MDGVSLVGLAKKYGTPLIVTSENRIVDNCNRLRTAFERHYGKVLFKYAVKSNSNPRIVSIVAGEGFGADASSAAEIDIALMAGIKARDILFSPNYASVSELKYALDRHVAINFDDTGQFDLLSRYGIPDIVSFRLNPGFGRGEFPSIITAGPKAKFGIPQDAIAGAYERAVRKGAKRFGIHMMAGSNVLEPEYFAIITSKILDAAGRISKQAGIEFDFINIGGGLGVPYRPTEKGLDIDKTARLVADVFRKKCAEHWDRAPALMMEPGRYIVADSAVLLGTVNHVKRYSVTFIGTDVGMNILIRPSLYGAYHEVAIANKVDRPGIEKASLTGEICENTDIIAKDRKLPKAEDGDIIAIFNAGAYVYGMSSQYNSRPRPAEVLIKKDGKYVLIRRRETTSDILSTVL